MSKQEEQSIGDLKSMVHTLSEDLVEQAMRLKKLEDAVAAHNLACAENNAALAEMKEILLTVKAGMKITNCIQKIVLWLLGVGVAVAEIYNGWGGKK
jgi:hypothetical protein